MPQFSTTILAQTQGLSSDGFKTFILTFEKQPQCRLPAHMALQKVGLRLVLQSISRGRYISPPLTLAVRFLFLILVSSPDLLCSVQQKAAFDWWTKWHLCKRKKSLWVVLWSRRLQEAKTSYWLIWWSQTQSPFKVPWFSITFLNKPTGCTGWSFFPVMLSFADLLRQFGRERGERGGKWLGFFCFGGFFLVGIPIYLISANVNHHRSPVLHPNTTWIQFWSLMQH